LHACRRASFLLALGMAWRGQRGQGRDGLGGPKGSRKRMGMASGQKDQGRDGLEGPKGTRKRDGLEGPRSFLLV
jgi:hypothetical protein